MDGVMHAPTLLAAARAAGLAVTSTGGRLSVGGPKRAAGLVRLLLDHRAGVLPLLSGSPGEPAEVEPAIAGVERRSAQIRAGRDLTASEADRLAYAELVAHLDGCAPMTAPDPSPTASRDDLSRRRC